MALGSYDANGIWHYGESDNIALFSDTLNKLADSASSAITSDRARISTLEAGSLAGLIPIKPTAATFVTGTGAVNSLGTVTFSGCSAIDLRGVFTSAFRSYVLVIEGVKNAVAGNDAVYAQFSSAGTRATGANYSTAVAAFLMTDASIQNLGGSGVSNFYLSRIYQASARFTCQFTIFNPNNAVVTNWTGQAYGTTLGNEQQIITSGGHNLATAYDGIYLYASANLISGTVTIYGLND
jgi:hypothetical protein